MFNETKIPNSCVNTLQPVDQTVFPISNLPAPLIIRIMSLAGKITPIHFILNRAMFDITKGEHYYNDLYVNLKAKIIDQNYWKQWGDPDAVPRLPISWIFQFNPSEEAMLFVPQRLIRNGNNAVEYLNLKTMGQWASNPAQGHPLSYSPRVWKEALEKRRKVEAPHWIRIKKEPIVVGADDLKNLDRQVASMVDVVVSVFAMFHTEFSQPTTDSDCISLPEKIYGKRIGIRIQKQGIQIGVDATIPHRFLAVQRWFGEQNGQPIPPSGIFYPELAGLSIDELKKEHEKAQQEALIALVNIRKSKSVYRVDPEIKTEFEDAREKAAELMGALLEKIPDLYSKMIVAEQELYEQLSAQIAVFAEGKVDNSKELKASIEILGTFHDRHIINGHHPVKALEAISCSCRHNLEQFLYEFISSRIDASDIDYASALVDRFYAAARDTISFDLLRIRTWIRTNPEGAVEIIHNLLKVAEGERSNDISLHFQLLSAARKLYMHEVYLKLANKIVSILHFESDLKHLLADLKEYSSNHIRKDIALRQIWEIEKERKGKDPNSLFMPHDLVLIKIDGLLNMLRKSLPS